MEEDPYFADSAQCREWVVADAIRANVDLFVINSDLTTYKATNKEGNFWIDRLVGTATHGPVILVAGNYGAELEGDLPASFRHIPGQMWATRGLFHAIPLE